MKIVEQVSLLVNRDKTPEFLEKDEDGLPIPDFISDLQLTVGDILGRLKV